MKYFLIILFTAIGSLVFAQEKETKIPKFKPPVVKTFLGINQNGASVTKEEATQLVAIPLRVTDDKKNTYEIVSYQFLYRSKGVVENEENGKREEAFTIVSGRFNNTPLPEIWVNNIKDNLKKDEQLYYFDILVKDKQGRKFSAPEIKITIL